MCFPTGCLLGTGATSAGKLCLPRGPVSCAWAQRCVVGVILVFMWLAAHQLCVPSSVERGFRYVGYVGYVGWNPWNSMESMEFHGFHGIQSTAQSTVQSTVQSSQVQFRSGSGLVPVPVWFRSGPVPVRFRSGSVISLFCYSVIPLIRIPYSAIPLLRY